MSAFLTWKALNAQPSHAIIITQYSVVINELTSRGGCYITTNSAATSFDTPLYCRHLHTPALVRRCIDTAIPVAERRPFSVVVCLPDMKEAPSTLLITQLQAILCSLGMSAYAVTQTKLNSAFSRRVIQQLPCLLTPPTLQKEAYKVKTRIRRTLYVAFITLMYVSLSHFTLPSVAYPQKSTRTQVTKRNMVPPLLLAGLAATCKPGVSIQLVSYPPLHLVLTSLSVPPLYTLFRALKSILPEDNLYALPITIIPGAPTSYQLTIRSNRHKM